jgi:hypothetical protein
MVTQEETHPVEIEGKAATITVTHVVGSSSL